MTLTFKQSCRRISSYFTHARSRPNVKFSEMRGFSSEEWKKPEQAICMDIPTPSGHCDFSSVLAEVTFLGTSSSTPTKRRNSAALGVRLGPNNFLFDCAEGTQRQIACAKGLNLHQLDCVFITHLHGDHFYGINGLITSWCQLTGTDKVLCIYGPVGLARYLAMSRTLVRAWESNRVKVTELVAFGHYAPATHPADGVVERVQSPAYEHVLLWQDLTWSVYAFPVQHCIPCWGFAIVEKPRGRFSSEQAEKLGIPFGQLRAELSRGAQVTLQDGTVIKPSQVIEGSRRSRKIVYITDSMDASSGEKIGQDADLLIHECTFENAMRDKARASRHSTPREVGLFARKTNCRTLCLTHISARYGESCRQGLLLDEVRTAMDPHTPHVFLAEDFMTVRISRYPVE
eukprot:gb/GEZN01006674.1/.p1 GENE.gb/GEZN01006674.1/~~gb/GEZN01006674.1/.p1  ORF type:complete len:423 (-),score=21.57 gb/GEZN01006674.1/:362-1564(-)